jgi:hypothetical protein
MQEMVGHFVSLPGAEEEGNVAFTEALLEFHHPGMVVVVSSESLRAKLSPEIQKSFGKLELHFWTVYIPVAIRS